MRVWGAAVAWHRGDDAERGGEPSCGGCALARCEVAVPSARQH